MSEFSWLWGEQIASLAYSFGVGTFVSLMFGRLAINKKRYWKLADLSWIVVGGFATVSAIWLTVVSSQIQIAERKALDLAEMLRSYQFDANRVIHRHCTSKGLPDQTQLPNHPRTTFCESFVKFATINMPKREQGLHSYISDMLAQFKVSQQEDTDLSKLLGNGNKISGRVLDPSGRKAYIGSWRLDEKNQLQLKVCVGLICKKEIIEPEKALVLGILLNRDNEVIKTEHENAEFILTQSRLPHVNRSEDLFMSDVEWLVKERVALEAKAMSSEYDWESLEREQYVELVRGLALILVAFLFPFRVGKSIFELRHRGA